MEMESISNELSDAERRNAELAKRLGEKQEELSRLSSERLKQKQQVISIKEENKALIAKSSKEEERARVLQRALDATRKQSADALEALAQANEEMANLEHLAGERARSLEDTTREARSLGVENEELKKARDAFYRRLEEIAPRMDQQNTVVHSLEARVKDLEAKLRSAVSASVANVDQSDETLLEFYRKQVYCSVETSFRKDVMLQRCGHLFSRKAIEHLIAIRNRKCPICGEKFGQDDVRTVFLS